MRTNTKKIFAVLLTVALVATMFVMPANAVKTYGDYLDDTVVNGDFEVGKVGMAVYGWELQSIENNIQFSTVADYTKNFTLTTALEGDNKVAALTKHNSGYCAMGSQPVNVVGGKEYYITYDAKLVDVDFTPRENCVDCAKYGSETCQFVLHWQGVSTSVRQYDADGNLLDANGAVTDSASYTQTLCSNSRKDSFCHEITKDFLTSTYKFTAHANTAYVKIYIGTGVFGNVADTVVYFDNVTLTSKENAVYGVSNIYEAFTGGTKIIKDANFYSEIANTTDLFNGDFEQFAFYKEGSRTNAVAGPAGWFSVGCNAEGSNLVDNHTNRGANNYQLISKTEVDAEGNVNTYVEYTLKHSYMSSLQNATDANPENLIGANYNDTRYYNYTHSNMMKIPVAAGETFTVNYKFKSYTADGSDTMVHGTQTAPKFMILMFNKDGRLITPATNITRFMKSINIAVAEWTDNSITVTAPAESKGAVYYTIGFHQAVKPGDKVNAVYCFDDITVEYEKTEETEEERYERLGFEEKAASFSSGQDATTASYKTHYEMHSVTDNLRGDVLMLTGSASARASTNQSCPAYASYWNTTEFSVTAGTKLKIYFDYKVSGTEKFLAVNADKGGTNTELIHGAPARVMIRYYDATGAEILANKDGTLVSGTSGEANKLAYVQGGNSKGDTDGWQSATGTVVVPANAVTARFGMPIFNGNTKGSAWVEHYFDNIIVKAETDTYWNSDEFAKISSGVLYETNLFNKIILSEGDALVADTDEATLINLVKMNNANTVTNNAIGGIAYTDPTDAAYDMNKDGRITNDDITFFRWKLLGITDESKAVI